jgi:hypothetical protein
LGAIGFDDEVDCQAARGPGLGRPSDGHQRSSGANHASRPLRDLPAEDIENQINVADVFQGVVIENLASIAFEPDLFWVSPATATANTKPSNIPILSFRSVLIDVLHEKSDSSLFSPESETYWTKVSVNTIVQ